MDDPKAPDFAMLRAVEILAQMHERARTRNNPPPPQLDFTLAFQSERLELRLGDTTRASVEEILGTAFSYPARGWHTYAVRARPRSFLSLFYRRHTLLAAEIYVPRAERVPQIALVDAGDLRLEPGSVAIGTSVDAMP